MSENNLENETKTKELEELFSKMTQSEDPIQVLNNFKSEIKDLKTQINNLKAEEEVWNENYENLNKNIDLFNKESKKKANAYNEANFLNEKAKASQPVIDYYTKEVNSKFVHNGGLKQNGSESEINQVFQYTINQIRLDFNKLNQKSKQSVQNLQNQKQQARTKEEKYYISIKIELEKERQKRIERDYKNFENAIEIKSKLHEGNLKLNLYYHNNNVEEAKKAFQENGINREKDGDEQMPELKLRYNKFVEENRESIKNETEKLATQENNRRFQLNKAEERLNDIFNQINDNKNNKKTISQTSPEIGRSRL